MHLPGSRISNDASQCGVRRLVFVAGLWMLSVAGAAAAPPFFGPARPRPASPPPAVPETIAPVSTAPSSDRMAPAEPTFAEPTLAEPTGAEPTMAEPTLAAPATSPIAPGATTDAPLFRPNAVSPGLSSPAYAVPALRTPVLPFDSGNTSPETITTFRPDGAACVLIDCRIDFLNRLIASPQQVAGPVNDTILGAQVQGEQTTRTNVTLMGVPNSSLAHLDVVLGGEVRSQTTAVTPQAAIQTRGTQRFDFHKPIEFDGSKFLTRSPGGRLESCQENLRARTGASQIPVVNSLAETVVLNQANRRQPLARQEAARRVASRVTPAFNTEIDQRLGAANDWLANLATTMPQLHGFLTAGRWSTTAETIAGELPGSSTVGTAPPPARGGASIRVHESFTVSLATATQLQGREITVEDLRRWIDTFDRDLSRQPRDPSTDLPPLSAPSEAGLRLAQENPLLARYSNGEIRVILRAAILAGEGLELPMHRISLGYSIRRSGDVFSLEPLPVTVTAEGNDSLAAGAIEQVIQSQIEGRLRPVTFASDAFPMLPSGVQPRISDIQVDDGWLTIVVD